MNAPGATIAPSDPIIRSNSSYRAASPPASETIGCQYSVKRSSASARRTWSARAARACMPATRESPPWVTWTRFPADAAPPPVGDVAAVSAALLGRVHGQIGGEQRPLGVAEPHDPRARGDREA